MKHELKLSNKAFAEELVAHLKGKKIDASLAEQDKKFVIAYEIKADDTSCADEKLALLAQYLLSRMDDSMNYVYSQIDNLWNAFYQHNQGHLPPLTPSGLQKLIKVAGMEDDYVVAPRTIYASSIEFNTSELTAALKKINEDNKTSQDGEVGKLMQAIAAQKKK